VSLLKISEHRSWWIVAVIILLTAAWMASGALDDEPGSAASFGEGASAENALLPEVQVRRQSAEPVMRHVRIYGRTEPARSVGVRSQTRGRVTAIGAARGERVEADTVLLELDLRDRQERLEEARARLRQRELEYQARQRLGDQSLASASQVAEAEALLEQARTELRRAELDMEYMRIRAPFDGEIMDRMVEIGDFVDPGDTVLDFVDSNTLVAAAGVAEQDIAGLSEGQAGSARLITGSTAEGRLRYIAPVADPATRTFLVELAFDNRERNLPAGVTAELELPVAEVQAHRMSPALLTLDEDGTLGVKLLDDRDRVDFVPARIVHSTPEAVWLDGLPEQITLITRGQGFVQQGQQVRAVPADGDRAGEGSGTAR